MKKSIIAGAIALAATTASVHANVEVYGQMRLYQNSTKTGGVSISGLANDLSRVGVKGSEDLGNGVKANYVIETAVSADSPDASTIGSRQSIFGFSNSLGSISLGRDKHSAVKVVENYDALSAFFGSSAFTIHNNQGSRFNNGIYVSLTPTKALKINYQHSSSETAGSKDSYGAGVDIDLGTLSTSVAQYSNNAGNETNNVGAKLSLASTGTTLFALYSQDTVNSVKTTGKSVGINQRFGAVTLMASYGEKPGVDAHNLGASYALSKRTSLEARYRNENHTDNTKDVQQVGVGVMHRF
jgi:predicted porin